MRGFAVPIAAFHPRKPYLRRTHGRMSSHSLELFARGQHVSASVTFAHSLERPDPLTEREAPIYFRVDFSL